jgi:hypothetical protein
MSGAPQRLLLSAQKSFEIRKHLKFLRVDTADPLKERRKAGGEKSGGRERKTGQ